MPSTARSSRTRKAATRHTHRSQQHFGIVYIQTTIREDYEAIVQVYATDDRECSVEILGPFLTADEARVVGAHRLLELVPAQVHA